MAKFRKKPVVIEAWPFSERGHTPKPDWLIDANGKKAGGRRYVGPLGGHNE